ncbi:MAG TPA: WD40 repeat domain-containing protein [Thermoanaerobaculia bacterium]|nr:WD40 repeat domain-containing protein [Thermoanaerobaculia bacterium]
MDTVTGKELGRLQLPSGQPFLQSVSADGARGIVVIGKETFVYDLPRRRLTAEPRFTHVSPDGHWLAALQDATHAVVRPFDGGREHIITPGAEILGLFFSPRSDLLMIWMRDSIAAHEITSGRLRGRANACFAQISPDEQWLVVADCLGINGSPPALRLVSLTGTKPSVGFSSYTFSPGLPAHQDLSFTFSRDSRLLATAVEGERVCIWSVPDGKLLQRLPVRAAATSPAFDADGGRVAVIDEATIRVFDARHGSLLGIFASYGKQFCATHFIGDGDQLMAVTCLANTPHAIAPLPSWWRTDVPVWNTARERRPPEEIRRLADSVP